MTDMFRKDYRELGPEANELIADVKEMAQKLHDLIGRAESVGTAGDSIQLSQRKIQEAVFWAVHGIEA